MSWLIRFPRLSSRGPIEVAALERGNWRRNGGFRDYQVAAPLKLVRCSSIRAGICRFRDYQVAAPLKSGLGVLRGDHGVGFRDYQVAAPLKWRVAG